jgi:hypothetical protein
MKRYDDCTVDVDFYVLVIDHIMYAVYNCMGLDIVHICVIY